MKPLKWYQVRKTRFTGEYLGGLLAGFGAGILIVWSGNVGLLKTGWTTFAILGGPALIGLGSFFAWQAQTQRETQDERGKQG